MTRVLLIALISLMAVTAYAQAASRIKDVAMLQSSRDNQLVGYGLVIGLQGTGDNPRNAPFTDQSMRAMLENLGIAAQQATQARSRNVAAVIVTANLPPFIRLATASTSRSRQWAMRIPCVAAPSS
jgi:flagellar P-ring protein FlgI